MRPQADLNQPFSLPAVTACHAAGACMSSGDAVAFGASLPHRCSMATEKPRITITLEPEHYAILQRMAKAQGGSMSRIVTDMVAELAPMLDRVAVSLEAAAKAQQGMKASIRRAAEQAEEDMRPLLETARSQFDFFASQMERLANTAQEVRPEPPKTPTVAGVADGGRPRGGKAQNPRPVITGVRSGERRKPNRVRRAVK